MKTFRAALMDAISDRDISLKSVAEGAGVSYEQLKKLGQNKSKSTNVDDAIKIARYFGQTLDQFLEDDQATNRVELMRLYNQLTDQERAILLRSAKGVLATRDTDT